MNKNILNIAIFGVLCALAGVFVGAAIVKNTTMPQRRHNDRNFSDKADRFMGSRWHKDGMRHGNPIEKISQVLSLNAEQKTKVNDILEKTRSEIEVVGKNMRSSIREIKNKGDAQIMTILTPEQQTKFQEIRKEMDKKFERKRHDWDKTPMTPPCPMNAEILPQ